MADFRVIEGDALASLREMASDSADGSVFDPPYGLGTREPTVDEIIAYLTGSRLDTGGDFMGKDWDLPSVALWREFYRVLRPGAHALVFGGTRMFDLLTIGLRAAGFEVRDCLSWIYGSGFPKSHDVSKAIDEKFGAERPVIGEQTLTGSAAVVAGGRGTGDGTAPSRTIALTGPATEEAKQFDGYGTAMKPAWEPIVLVRKPIDGTIAKNALAHGTGGLNINGCRIEGSSGNGHWSADDGSDATSRPGFEGGFTKGGEKQPLGRWPANVAFSHLDDCVFVGTKRVKSSGFSGGFEGDTSQSVAMSPKRSQIRAESIHVDKDCTEEVEEWECPPWCPVAQLDAQSGNRPGMSGGGAHREEYTGGMFGAIDSTSTARNDIGGASRFFYCSKASRAEREFGCDQLPARAGHEAVERKAGTAGVNNPRAGAGRTAEHVRNHHPTVKPIDLTRWLATLLLPPVIGRPRRILIPFSGSGSEMIGAMRAGWDEIIGLERDIEYAAIARARLVRWTEVPDSMSVEEAVSDARAHGKKIDKRQIGLF